jgi:hypothetical protein
MWVRALVVGQPGVEPVDRGRQRKGGKRSALVLSRCRCRAGGHDFKTSGRRRRCSRLSQTLIFPAQRPAAGHTCVWSDHWSLLLLLKVRHAWDRSLHGKNGASRQVCARARPSSRDSAPGGVTWWASQCPDYFQNEKKIKRTCRLRLSSVRAKWKPRKSIFTWLQPCVHPTETACQFPWLLIK